MPKVTDEYRSAKRREIADAALRAFRRKGFQGASMADIIAESGLSAGAIYGHYAGKSDIVFEVATQVVGARIVDVGRLAHLDPMPSPGQLLPVLLRGMLDEIGEPAILVQLWGEAVTDPNVSKLTTEVFLRLQTALTSYVSLWHQREHRLPKADADQIGHDQVPLLISAAQGFILQSALVPNFNRDAYLLTLETYLPR